MGEIWYKWSLNSPDFAKILGNPPIFSKILENSWKFSEILENSRKYWKIKNKKRFFLENLGRIPIIFEDFTCQILEKSSAPFPILLISLIFHWYLLDFFDFIDIYCYFTVASGWRGQEGACFFINFQRFWPVGFQSKTFLCAKGMRKIEIGCQFLMFQTQNLKHLAVCDVILGFGGESKKVVGA